MHKALNVPAPCLNQVRYPPAQQGPFQPTTVIDEKLMAPGHVRVSPRVTRCRDTWDNPSVNLPFARFNQGAQDTPDPPARHEDRAAEGTVAGPPIAPLGRASI